MKIKRLIRNFSPCGEAMRWMLTQKNAEEAWKNCERGDWMLWLAKKLNVNDKTLTMAKAMCAKQVEHLMRDQKSKDALQACFDYVNGKITRKELDAAANAADAAAYAANAVYASYAADAAAYAAYAAAYAANANAAYAAAYAADAAARQSSLRKSADICREYLTEEIISKYKKLR